MPRQRYHTCPKCAKHWRAWSLTPCPWCGDDSLCLADETQEPLYPTEDLKVRCKVPCPWCGGAEETKAISISVTNPDDVKMVTVPCWLCKKKES